MCVEDGAPRGRGWGGGWLFELLDLGAWAGIGEGLGRGNERTLGQREGRDIYQSYHQDHTCLDASEGCPHELQITTEAEADRGKGGSLPSPPSRPLTPSGCPCHHLRRGADEREVLAG